MTTRVGITNATNDWFLAFWKWPTKWLWTWKINTSSKGIVVVVVLLSYCESVSSSMMLGIDGLDNEAMTTSENTSSTSYICRDCRNYAQEESYYGLQ